MSRAAHGVLAGNQVWLIDPFEDGDGLSVAAQLGTAGGVIQLLDRHDRDCETVAERLGVPLYRVAGSVPESPFEVIAVRSGRAWREVALWWAEKRVLIIAEAIGTAPLFTLGRRAGVHPALRLTAPREALGGLRPELLLVGHGPALERGASEALQEALSKARSDIPKLVTKLPWVLRNR
jgi:hypothetical protein